MLGQADDEDEGTGLGGLTRRVMRTLRHKKSMSEAARKVSVSSSGSRTDDVAPAVPALPLTSSKKPRGRAASSPVRSATPSASDALAPSVPVTITDSDVAESSVEETQQKAVKKQHSSDKFGFFRRRKDQVV